MSDPRRIAKAGVVAAGIFRRLFQPGLIGNLGSNGFAQAVQIVLQLLTVPLYSRFLGIERYGVWLLLTTVPAYLAFSDFGLTTASAADMTARLARGDFAGAAQTYRAMRRRLMIAGLGVGAVVGGVAALPGTLDFAAEACGGRPGVALGAIVLYGLGVLHCTGTFAAFRAAGGYAGAVYRIQIIILAEALAALAVAGAGGGLVSMAFAFAGVRTVGAVWLWRELRRHHRVFVAPPAGTVDRGPGALTGPALAALALSLAAMMTLQGAVGMVGAFAGAIAVPAFAATRTMTRLPLQIALMANLASLPAYAASKARGDDERAANHIVLTLAALLFVLVPGAIVLAVAGPALLAMWTGGRIHASNALLGWAIVAMLANGCWVGLSNFLLSLNRQADFSPAYLALAVAGGGAAIWVLPVHGAAGAAFIVAMIDLAMVCLVLRQAVRHGIISMALIRSAPARCAAMVRMI